MPALPPELGCRPTGPAAGLPPLLLCPHSTRDALAEPWRARPGQIVTHIAARGATWRRPANGRPPRTARLPRCQLGPEPAGGRHPVAPLGEGGGEPHGPGGGLSGAGGTGLSGEGERMEGGGGENFSGSMGGRSGADWTISERKGLKRSVGLGRWGLLLAFLQGR